MNYQPYCYLIGWSKHNRWYYGSEYSVKRKIANPCNLWVSYFTSSYIVDNFRKLNGDPDIIQIRRIFQTAEEAISWEYRVLRRLKVRHDNRWLNVYDGRSPPGRPEPLEKRIAHSQRMAGSGNPNYGKTTSQHVRNKISESVKRSAKIKPNGMLGRKHNDQARLKMRMNHPRLSGEANPNYGRHMSEDQRERQSLIKSKTRKFFHTEHGSVEKTTRQMLKEFPGLKRTGIVALYNGHLKSYKGWVMQ